MMNEAQLHRRKMDLQKRFRENKFETTYEKQSAKEKRKPKEDVHRY